MLRPGKVDWPQWPGRMAGVACFGAAAAFLFVACDAKDHTKTPESPQVSAVKASAEASPVEPTPAPVEFQVGRWSGVAAPKPAAQSDDVPKDDQELAGAVILPSEPLSIVLAVDEAGGVTGEARLGAHQSQLSGEYDESQIRASFSGPRVTGTLLLARKDAEFRGQVRLSLVNRSGSAEHLAPFVAELALNKQN